MDNFFLHISFGRSFWTTKFGLSYPILSHYYPILSSCYPILSSYYPILSHYYPMINAGMFVGCLLPVPEKKTSQVGIASVWYQGNPCNMHLLSLGEDVKKEVDKDAI